MTKKEQAMLDRLWIAAGGYKDVCPVSEQQLSTLLWLLQLCSSTPPVEDVVVVDKTD